MFGIGVTWGDMGLYGAIYGWLSKLWSFFGTLNTRGRITIGIQKGPIILTTTHMVIQGLHRVIW